MANKKLAVTIKPTVETSVTVKPAAKKYADSDTSIDARMWRLEQDHIRMGARPKA